MTEKLEERLNRIPEKITSDGFLRGRGNGNDVAFYIFDYLPEAEIRIREYLAFLLPHISKTNPSLRLKHINLFHLVLKSLERRGLLERSFAKQKREGDAALLKSLKTQFEGPRLAEAFVTEADPANHDLVVVSGVGNAFPVVRAHSLLSALQPKMGQTPLVMFYPGVYDGRYVRLFGQVISDLKNPYYRAFRLVP